MHGMQREIRLILNERLVVQCDLSLSAERMGAQPDGYNKNVQTDPIKLGI